MPEVAIQDRKKIKYIEDLIKFFDETRFYRPSLKLTEKIVERLYSLDNLNKRKGYIRNDRDLAIQQKLFGEQVYLYLANLSKTPEANKGKGLNLETEINEWFGKSIGLANESKDKEILLDLADDFNKWIENQETFLTDWGKINSVGNKNVVLERFNKEDYV